MSSESRHDENRRDLRPPNCGRLGPGPPDGWRGPGHQRIPGTYCADTDLARIQTCLPQGGVSLELTTPETHCDAGDATQPLPNAPQGQVEGGSSEYVDGKVYQCCGSNVNIYDACFSLTLGDENWADVRKNPSSD